MLFLDHEAKESFIFCLSILYLLLFSFVYYIRMVYWMDFLSPPCLRVENGNKVGEGRNKIYNVSSVLI